MKKRLVFIAFTCVLALFALSTCENQQVIGLLKDPSELDFLEITAYADEIVLAGGTSLSPGFRNSVFDYTVYVAKDANRFSIHAGTDKEATVSAVCINDGETGLEFDFIGDADKTIHLTVQIKHMERTDYRLTVVRGEPNAVARNIEIWVEPRIGAFFIGSGVIPKIKVTADLPPQGGTLSYQWYVNDQNTSRGGSLLSGATGDTYTMQRGETLSARTVYYYVEITNTIGGRAAVTESVPCKVTFLNKNEMHPKSIAMIPVPAGNVSSSAWGTGTHNTYQLLGDFSTPGFLMGQCPVTWELWKIVWDHAEAVNYGFARKGNKGGTQYTNLYPRPIGNQLHPVTLLGWREAVVWCNAYSEMDGLEPVYRDAGGEPLRDSRDAVDELIDYDAVETAGYNGYRLPTIQEWYYAAKGANPGGAHWDYKYPGTNNDDLNELGKYLWAFSPEAYAQTGEVGRMIPVVLPNGSELYDMMGMVRHWIDWPSEQQQFEEVYNLGNDFFSYDKNDLSRVESNAAHEAYSFDTAFVGFRLARNGGN